MQLTVVVVWLGGRTGASPGESVSQMSQVGGQQAAGPRTAGQVLQLTLGEAAQLLTGAGEAGGVRSGGETELSSAPAEPRVYVTGRPLSWVCHIQQDKSCNALTSYKTY